jgi:hypothetical protein
MDKILQRGDTIVNPKRVACTVVLFFFLAGCARSESEIATMTAAAWTPTPPPTPTATPVPYDLTVHIADEAGSPLAGVSIVMTESGSEEPIQTDASGAYTWTNVRGPTVNLSVSEPGYVSAAQPVTLERGLTEMALILQRDPLGLLAADACATGERLVYIEDFQDGKAQGWNNMTAGAELAADNGWSIAAEETGDQVGLFTGPHEGIDQLEGMTFEDFVWRLNVRARGSDGFSFLNLKWVPSPEGGTRYPIQWGTNALLDVTRLQMPTPGHFSVAQSTFRAQDDQWYYLELSVFQGLIQVWLDGEKLVEYQDPQPLPAGMISLEAHAPNDGNTTYAFDDLAVCELSGPFTTTMYKPPAE